jgi:membrane associated rhomboid family serine protease
MLPVRDHLPTRGTPWVNYALIAANVAVFAIEAGSADLGSVAFVPAHFWSDPLASASTLVTHQYLHASIAHLAGNMLFLWIFGDNVEDMLGHARYALFYTVCGVCAALAQFAANPWLEAPMVGASGAISGVLAGYLVLYPGVLAGYLVLYPTSRITVVNPIPILWLFWGVFIVFPAWLVILEFFAANLLSAFGGGAASDVAFVAHVGGFVAGLVLLPILRVNDKVDYAPWERWLSASR